MNFVIIVVVAALATCYAQSNHAFWGQVGWNHTLVYSSIMNKSSSMLQVIELDVQYPPKVSAYTDLILLLTLNYICFLIFFRV